MYFRLIPARKVQDTAPPGHGSRAFECWVYSNKLRLGSAMWQQIQSFQGCFFLHVIEYLVDHLRVFNLLVAATFVLPGRILYDGRRLRPANCFCIPFVRGNCLTLLRQLCRETYLRQSFEPQFRLDPPEISNMVTGSSLSRASRHKYCKP